MLSTSSLTSVPTDNEVSLLEAPFGWVGIRTRAGKAVSIHLGESPEFVLRTMAWSGKISSSGSDISRCISDYFAGDPAGLTRALAFVETDRREGTAIQTATWAALLTVPLGTTVSYGELAARASVPKAIRAVATAVGRNRFPLVLPCHRIIRTNGSLGEFSAGSSVEVGRCMKQWLLRHEKNLAGALEVSLVERVATRAGLAA